MSAKLTHSFLQMDSDFFFEAMNFWLTEGYFFHSNLNYFVRFLHFYLIIARYLQIFHWLLVHWLFFYPD